MAASAPSSKRSACDPLGRPLYVSPDLSVQALGTSVVNVNLCLEPGAFNPESLRDVFAVAAKNYVQTKAKTGDRIIDLVSESLKQAATEIFKTQFEAEIDKVISAYRVKLQESLATGEDEALKTALNRARLQEKILAGTSMVEQSEACELLGMSTANPSATMKRKEEKG